MVFQSYSLDALREDMTQSKTALCLPGGTVLRGGRTLYRHPGLGVTPAGW